MSSNRANRVRETKSYDKRRILAQVLASVGNAFQYFSLGAAINYGAVEVAGLSTQDDIIKTTEEDLSWIGSICFIMQATGNILGGPNTSLLGRKRAMLLGNIPYIVGWVLMWQSTSVGVLLLGNAFLGLGTGLLCSPMASYTGEIVEPSVRGTLASISEVFAGFGSCGVFILGTLVTWRTTAVVYLGEALFATFVLIWLPESPIWLLSKGREEEALNSLCWLRGWVQPEQVKREFEDLKLYNRHNMSCKKCEAIGIDSMDSPAECTHVDLTLWQRIGSTLSEFSRREARRPLILACGFFIFGSMTSLVSIKPTMINILAAYNVPFDAKWAMAGVGVLTILGAVGCMALVKRTGKRPLVLTSMMGSFVCTLVLGVYAQAYIPPETSSFESSLEELTSRNGEGTSVVPLVLFILMVFFNNLGIVPISWMIISEIFPYTVRGVCCGFVGAVCDVAFFIAAKTYLDVENSMHIFGGLYFYAGFTFVGIIFLYLFLIETEGKTFAEIEANFADRNTMFYNNDCLSRSAKACLCRKRRADADLPKNIEITLGVKDAQGHQNEGYSYCEHL